MSFPSALSAGQLAQIRTTTHSSRQYLLLCPNEIVWQTQPDENLSDTVFAEFDWTGTLQGDSADVKEGMTVLITTSDTDLSTVVYRGRVRELPSATDFFIGENSATITTALYVTVLDDLDMHERLERRTVDGSKYKDWDLPFQQLPPLITGLQSTYVDTSATATVDIEFAPTGDAIADGASISTWLWDIGDGSFQVGTSASQNITARFPGAVTNEHRWVTVTATDDNGVSTYFAFEVYTVDLTDTSTNVIELDIDSVNVTGSITSGFNVTVRAWDGFTSVLDRTRCTLLSVDDYGGMRKLDFTSGGTYEIVAGNEIEGATSGATATVAAIDLDSGTWAGGDAVGSLWVNTQSGTFEAENLNVGANNNVATIAANSANTPITQNVSFVGRLRQEENYTAGDERYGVLQETRLTVEGFITQLGGLHGAGLYLKTDSTPTEWGEVKSLTIKRAIIYMLAWHSTFLNVSGLTFDTDSDDYEWPEFVQQTASLLEWVNFVADDQNALLVIAADGQSTIQRDARITGVSGLTTVMTLQVNDSGDSDILDYTLERNYIDTHSQVIAGASTYNTTSGKQNTYIGRAPAQSFGPGWETAQLNQQIMKSDLSDADARTEVGTRVANYLAMVNPRPRITCELMPGMYWLVPTIHQLFAFNIAASDNTRGQAYTSADKWLLTEINYGYDPAIGAYAPPSATFELIVAGGTYGIQVTLVPDVNDLRLPILPGIGAGFNPIIDPLINYPIDDPDFDLPGLDAGITQPGPYTPQPELNCEALNVSMKTGSIVTTSESTVFGEPYTVTVQGQGNVDEITDEWQKVYAWENGDTKGWTLSQGQFLGGTNPNLYSTLVNPLAQLSIEKNYVGFDGLTSITLSSLAWYWPGSTSGTGIYLTINHGGGTWNNTYSADSGTVILNDFGTLNSVTYIQIRQVVNDANDGGSTRNRSITLDGTGSNPPPDTDVPTEDVYGDAFYYNYNISTAELYAGSNGFQVDSARPSGIPTYQSSHQYQFVTTGTGSPLGFRFLDSDYSDNNNVDLSVMVCGSGMKQG